MTITSWRVVSERYATTAFNGEGAKLYPGRWNKRGTPMVYTGQTLSLAVLELLVHLDGPSILPEYVAIPISFEESQCLRLPESHLPSNWAIHPPPPSTREIGTSWVQELSSLVLLVPSFLVPTEGIYLINPLHFDARSMKAGKPIKFMMDSRLIKK